MDNATKTAEMQRRHTTPEKFSSLESFIAMAVRRHQFVEPRPKSAPKSLLREYFESAVVTVVMALLGMTFIVQAGAESAYRVGEHNHNGDTAGQ